MACVWKWSCHVLLSVPHFEIYKNRAEDGAQSGEGSLASYRRSWTESTAPHRPNMLVTGCNPREMDKRGSEVQGEFKASLGYMRLSLSQYIKSKIIMKPKGGFVVG